jgi:tetratricopeptide (TPR) repeat protein
MGKWQQAIADLEQAIELDPRNPELLHQGGLTQLHRRDYAEAERYFDRALEIAPDDKVNHFAKAQIALFRDGDIGRLAAAQKNPPLGLTEVGTSLLWRVALYQRDYQGALNHLDGWPHEVNAFQWMYVPKTSYYGVTYRLAGQIKLAEKHFRSARDHLETALEKDPEDVRLYISLGEAMAGLGKREAAVNLALQAMDLMPASKDAVAGPHVQQDCIVRILIPAGDYDAAIDHLDNYLSGPGHWSIEGLLPDPRLDPIREDPRFLALVEKYRRE